MVFKGLKCILCCMTAEYLVLFAGHVFCEQPLNNVMFDSLRRGADQGGQAAPARLGAGAGLCQMAATL